MKSIYKILLIATFLYIPFISLFAQKQNNRALRQLAAEQSSEYQKQKAIAVEYAKKHHIPIREEVDGVLKEIQFIDDRGMPQYYVTFNENAAKTISTNKVYSGGGAGLSLSGSGVTVCEWDGGTVLDTHDELSGRVTNMDATATHVHSTHVAGTIMAQGVSTAAKGMAYAAGLKSYDWDDDQAEMANEAANGTLISNHSYGYLRGWGGSTWYGDTLISKIEDYRFGFYDTQSAVWDEVAYNAPYYLIMKAAGNDRNDTGDGSYPDDGPYDCIGQQGIAKNVLTVGAVKDITAGYSAPADVVMTSFSSWGPADDGRIKPDIVANGYGLTSCSNAGNSSYTQMSGTSMATPSVTGSAALLIEHYANTHGSGSKMRASTLKALIINTADEAGTSDGPDYKFGWGLMNTATAAAKISEDQTTDLITEHELLEGASYTREITTNGTSPIQVTLVWTDPAGSPVAASLDPADAMLVNDLDLKISQGGTIYYPWKLDAANPSDAATNAAKNAVDNVEQVYIAGPTTATTYTITVDHQGSLKGGSQIFSLVISGDITNGLAPVADFYADDRGPADHSPVQFTDASDHFPTSWSWSFSPSTLTYLNGTSSSSQNPEVEFTATGTYQVSLTATNAHGSDSETKTTYITVSDPATSYCDAYSTNDYGYLTRVQIGDIDQASTSTNIGGADPADRYYEDWTALSTDVVQGATYNVTINNGTSDTDIDIAIWVDWNRDGDFVDAGENMLVGLDNGGGGTFSMKVPLSAELGKTRMRIRSKYYGTDFNSCGSTSNGEVEDYTLNIVGGWTGTSGTDWATAANWSLGSLPTASDNVTIPSVPSGGSSPIIALGTTGECNNLKIESSASLQIRGALTVNGDLTNDAGISGLLIKSDAGGMGSLIQNSSSVSASVERYIDGWTSDTDGWHFLASPVATFNISGSDFEPGATDDLFAWDESTGLWENYKAVGGPTQIEMGKGYLISRGSLTTAVFTGVLNNADKTWSNLTYTPSYSTAGWHLLANPFPSAVLWDATSWALSANVSSVCKIFKESTASYIDLSSGDPIPATQGFLVYVSSGTNSLTIPLADRAHHSQNWYKDAPTNRFKLIVHDHEAATAQESVIGFNELATNGFDMQYDSYFFAGFAPQFYSIIPEGNLSTNIIGEVDWKTKIPFAFIKNASNSYDIEAEGINTLQPRQSVYLTDLKTGDSQLLNENPIYEFTSEEGDIAERFMVHFSALAVNDLQSEQQINAFSSHGNIEIRTSMPITAEVHIYSISGQFIEKFQMINESSASIPMQAVKGVVLLRIITKDELIVKAVILM